MDGPEVSNPDKKIPKTLHEVLDELGPVGSKLDLFPRVDIPEIGEVSIIEAVERGLSTQYIDTILKNDQDEYDEYHVGEVIDCLIGIQKELKKEDPDDSILLITRVALEAVLENHYM